MQTSSIPPLDIVDRSGRRRRVHLGSDSDTVADLRAAFGHHERAIAVIDGQAVVPGRRLTTVDNLLEGVEVCFDDPATAVLIDVAGPGAGEEHDDVGLELLEFSVVTGPSCHAWAPLPTGRHGLGRSPHATIRLLDELVEIHHAVIVVDPQGSITLTQLTGRVPVQVQRCSGRRRPAGPVEELHPGESLIVGSSRVDFRRRAVHGPVRGRTSGTLARVPGDPWHLEVRRTSSPPATTVEFSAAPPRPPQVIAMQAGTALVGTAVAAVGALAVASVLHQTMFAVFAVMGALASTATWAFGALTVLRRRRAARRATLAERERFVVALDGWHRSMLESHRRRHVEIADVITELDLDRSGVWDRRVPHADLDAIDGAIEVVIGRETVECRLRCSLRTNSCRATSTMSI